MRKEFKKYFEKFFHPKSKIFYNKIERKSSQIKERNRFVSLIVFYLSLLNSLLAWSVVVEDNGRK